jgi:hypothetical protein
VIAKTNPAIIHATVPKVIRVTTDLTSELMEEAYSLWRLRQMATGALSATAITEFSFPQMRHQTSALGPNALRKIG